MFDFLNNDWFIITLEIVFVALITYDVRNYLRTRKKEYITNIVLTAGFAIWTLYPMYTKYFGWEDTQREEMLNTCTGTADKNATELCVCVNEDLFKTYTNAEHMKMNRNSDEYKEYVKETKEDCLDDSWF